MKYENQSCKKQNKNLNVLKNIIWPSSRNYNQLEFDYDKRIKTNNVQMDQLKLRRSQNRIDIGKFCDEKWKTEWKKLPLKTIKSFKANQKTISNDTIYLYENQISKCVINLI